MEWSGLLGLICPLMMVGMMIWMMRGNRGNAGHTGGSCCRPGSQADASEGKGLAGAEGTAGAEKKASSTNRRRWLMLLCCLAPMAVAALLLLARPIGIGGDGSWLSLLVILACPLLHLILMPLMHRGNKHSSHS